MNTEMTKVEFRKIEAGHYVTRDGRFDVLDTYDPSGAPWVRSGRNSMRWLIKDTTDGGLRRAFTLSDARWQIGMTYEAMAKKGAGR